VEYKGVRYTIRTRIERNQWAVAIHPEGVEPIERVYVGVRPKAEKLARAMIDAWLRAPRATGFKLSAAWKNTKWRGDW
jgi:hypothetical protein